MLDRSPVILFERFTWRFPIFQRIGRMQQFSSDEQCILSVTRVVFVAFEQSNGHCCLHRQFAEEHVEIRVDTRGDAIGQSLGLLIRILFVIDLHARGHLQENLKEVSSELDASILLFFSFIDQQLTRERKNRQASKLFFFFFFSDDGLQAAFRCFLLMFSCSCPQVVDHVLRQRTIVNLYRLVMRPKIFVLCQWRKRTPN